MQQRFGLSTHMRQPAACVGLVLAGMVSFSEPASAVPSFARQTGFECTTCHVSWPELTSVGRQFKLGGYTLSRAADGARPLVSFDASSPPPILPLAAFVQASVSTTSRKDTPGVASGAFNKNDELVLQQASALLAGRFAEHAGGFVQWSYDGLAHHSALDNVDLRLASRFTRGALDVNLGVSLNNSPTVSDIYNSTPVWGFPFAGSSVSPTPAASTLIQKGLAQQVAGLTAYALFNGTLYAELGGYRTARGALSVLRAGADRSTAAVLDGTAPYWRFGLQKEWGEAMQSAMLGTFGLIARKYPDPSSPVGPVDRFNDIGVDAQYQYVTAAHRLSAQLAYIRERQRWDGTFPAGGATNPGDRLTTLSSKVTYYYLAKYGASMGYQRIGGDADPGLYATGEPVTGSTNGRPDSRAAIVEFNWLPWRDTRITLQYTGYQKFNGARSNYDGFGRNAKDNNTLFVLAWLAF